MRKTILLMILWVTTLNVLAGDTLQVEQEQPKEKLGWLRRVIRGFSYVDENYVEPQHYNWSVMLQATHTYDYYRLSTTGPEGQSVLLAPKPTVKAGPYFGWRWVFLGYTFDLKNFDVGYNSMKQEFDFSIYSAQIGADLYYRRTGSDYQIRDISMGKKQDMSKMMRVPFDGLSVGITGINLYYIFNHQRFSYPAAFAQSSIQKISCGSWMVGISYTRNSIEFDHEKLQLLLDQRLGDGVAKVDENLMFNSLEYHNTSASVGYAYNWVFARNCLFCSSLSLALAYKRTHGEPETQHVGSDGFVANNFNIDGIGRFGLVYNNMRWYAGASAIVRAYNYHTSRFAANNLFGSMNVYIGYNFGARSRYKKSKQ